MTIYVVILPVVEHPGQGLADAVAEKFSENDRFEIVPGRVWFVRSNLVTAAQVRDALGIELEKRAGIVVSSAYTTGIASSDFVQRFNAWGDSSQ